MAAVRLESKVWTDPRFEVLGKALGIDRDLAVAKLARVWSWQTEECTSTVPAALFDVIAGIEGFADAAIAAGLAERVADGSIRPRGSERLAWLAERRALAASGRAAGGLARAAGARRGERGEFLPAESQHSASNEPAEPSNSQQADHHHQLHQLAPAPAPAPALAPAHDQEHMDLGSPPARRPRVLAEAEELAELIREELVAQKSDHALARPEKWKSVKPTWARQLGALLKTDERRAERAAELIRWVFGDQGGSEYRFVVESPKTLREKWDRLEVAMAKRSRRSRGGGAEPLPPGFVDLSSPEWRNRHRVLTRADEDPVLGDSHRPSTPRDNPTKGGDEDPVLADVDSDGPRHSRSDR